MAKKPEPTPTPSATPTPSPTPSSVSENGNGYDLEFLRSLLPALARGIIKTSPFGVVAPTEASPENLEADNFVSAYAKGRGIHWGQAITTLGKYIEEGKLPNVPAHVKQYILQRSSGPSSLITPRVTNETGFEATLGKYVNPSFGRAGASLLAGITQYPAAAIDLASGALGGPTKAQDTMWEGAEIFPKGPSFPEGTPLGFGGESIIGTAANALGQFRADKVAYNLLGPVAAKGAALRARIPSKTLDKITEVIAATAGKGKKARGKLGPQVQAIGEKLSNAQRYMHGYQGALTGAVASGVYGRAMGGDPIQGALVGALLGFPLGRIANYGGRQAAGFDPSASVRGEAGKTQSAVVSRAIDFLSHLTGEYPTAASIPKGAKKGTVSIAERFLPALARTKKGNELAEMWSSKNIPKPVARPPETLEQSKLEEFARTWKDALDPSKPRPVVPPKPAAPKPVEPAVKVAPPEATKPATVKTGKTAPATVETSAGSTEATVTVAPKPAAPSSAPVFSHNWKMLDDTPINPNLKQVARKPVDLNRYVVVGARNIDEAGAGDFFIVRNKETNKHFYLDKNGRLYGNKGAGYDTPQQVIDEVNSTFKAGPDTSGQGRWLPFDNATSAKLAESNVAEYTEKAGTPPKAIASTVKKVKVRNAKELKNIPPQDWTEEELHRHIADEWGFTKEDLELPGERGDEIRSRFEHYVSMYKASMPDNGLWNGNSLRPSPDGYRLGDVIQHGDGWVAYGPGQRGDIERIRIGTFATEQEAKKAVEGLVRKLNAQHLKTLTKNRRRTAQHLGGVSARDKNAFTRVFDYLAGKISAQQARLAEVGGLKKLYQVKLPDAGVPGSVPVTREHVTRRKWNIIFDNKPQFQVTKLDRGGWRVVDLTVPPGPARRVSSAESTHWGYMDFRGSIDELMQWANEEAVHRGQGVRAPRLGEVWLDNLDEAYAASARIPGSQVVETEVPASLADRRRLVNLKNNHPVRKLALPEELTSRYHIPKKYDLTVKPHQQASEATQEIFGHIEPTAKTKLGETETLLQSHRWIYDERTKTYYLDMDGEGKFKAGLEEFLGKWVLLDFEGKPIGTADSALKAGRMLEQLVDGKSARAMRLLDSMRAEAKQWYEFKNSLVRYKDKMFAEAGDEIDQAYKQTLREISEAKPAKVATEPKVKREPLTAEAADGIVDQLVTAGLKTPGVVKDLAALNNIPQTFVKKIKQILDRGAKIFPEDPDRGIESLANRIRSGDYDEQLGILRPEVPGEPPIPNTPVEAAQQRVLNKARGRKTTGLTPEEEEQLIAESTAPKRTPEEMARTQAAIENWKANQRRASEDAAIARAKGVQEEAQGVIAGLKEAANVFTPKKLREERGSFSGKKSARTDINSLPTSREIMVFSDITPETALGGELAEEFTHYVSRAGLWTWIKLPISVFGRNPHTHEFYTYMLRWRNKIQMKIAPSLERRATNRIYKPHGIDESNFDEMITMANSIKMKEDGRYYIKDPDDSWRLLTLPREGRKLPSDPRDDIEAAALKYRMWITDRIWRIVRGYDAKAAVILRKYWPKGDGESEQTLKRIRAIQESWITGKPPEMPEVYDKATGKMKPGLPPRKKELDAAKATQGYLHFKSDGSDAYDLSGGEYLNGYFPHLPIQNERQWLEDELAKNRKLLAAFEDADPGQYAEYEDKIKRIQERLKKLDDFMVNRIEAKYGRFGSTLPSHQFYGPLSQARSHPEFGFDTDVIGATRRYLWGALNKRYMDIMYWNADSTLKQAKAGMGIDTDLKRYMFDWINLQRGIKGYNEDAWIRQLAFKFSKHGLDENTIRRITSEVMKFQALTKLFMALRFPLVNMTQTITTTYPVVGGRVYGRAVGKTMVDLIKYIGGDKSGRNAWTRAKANGALGEAGSRFLQEAESYGASTLDWIIQHWPLAKLAEWTETFNRVVSHEAGYIKAMSPGFDLAKARLVSPTTFIAPIKNPTKQQVANWYARGVVEATQFILTKEGKPLTYSGGLARRIYGQFQSYRVGYITLLHRLWKHDKPAFWRAIGAIGMLTGLPGVPLWEDLNRKIIEWGGPALPDNNGFNVIGNLIGITDSDSRAIDITSGLEPFNIPKTRQWRDIFATVAGPTFGQIPGLIEDAAKEGLVSPAMVRNVLRSISPELIAVGESLKAASQGGLVVQPVSKQPIKKLTDWEMMSRSVGWRPSVKSEYHNMRTQLKAAIRGKNREAFQTILERAKNRGVIFSKRNLAQIFGEVKADQKRAEIKTWGDVFK